MTMPFARLGPIRSWSSLILVSLFVLVLSSLACAAEWQWSVIVKGGLEPAGSARAFLWFPHGCQRLRGVVLAQHNLEEISILENPQFRQALGQLAFGEIWCAPPFDHLLRFNQGAGETCQRMMEGLADVVAWQYGRSSEPFLQTAEPVERTFAILK